MDPASGLLCKDAFLMRRYATVAKSLSECTTVSTSSLETVSIFQLHLVSETSEPTE